VRLFEHGELVAVDELAALQQSYECSTVELSSNSPRSVLVEVVRDISFDVFTCMLQSQKTIIFNDIGLPWDGLIFS
jgi:hypothetical protein